MNEHNDRSRINAWIGNLWRHLQPRAAGEDPLVQVTDRVVQVADPVIRQAKGYRQVLADPIAGAMKYFQSLLETIPGPVALDRRRYYDDPTVKALFASPAELDEVLRFNPEINKLRKQGLSGEMVAMMTMLRQERSIFGHKQEGELIIRDVRQQAVSFTDHRIVAPSVDLETTREGIVNRGLEVLATVAMERITTLRANKAELQGKKEYLQGMMKILGGRSHRQEIFAAPTTQNREELRKVEQLLAEVEQELEKLRQQIALPEQSLAYLEDVLRQPDSMLAARRQSLRLDWKGVRVDDEPGSEGNDITLAEFSMEDVRRFAVLVTFTLTAAPESPS
ncbi:hypothetical protein [Desulfobulbus propionicus]